MRVHRFGLCWIVTMAAAILVSAMSEAQSGEPAADGEFIVHEWGTFTSYSGSDGVRLGFRPLVDNDLPNFIFDWLKWSGRDVLLKSRYRARQRMETPITYFYTDRVREVDVKAGFPDGVLTEFYPPVLEMAPHAAPPTAPADATADSLRGGLLNWGRITLIPEAALRPKLDNSALADAIARRAFESLPVGSDPDPELFSGDHYYFARETDSALVHVQLPAAIPNMNFELGLRPSGDFFEKFLFYRGIGNFDLPLTVDSRDDGRLGIFNRGAQPLTGLLLVQVQDGEVRFSPLNDVPGGEGALVPGPTTSGADAAQQLAQAMQQILLRQGLYEKEATAMVRTWHASWFTDEGTRLLYIVPRAMTDELLPLTISPPPQQTVRVLVGRLEVLPASEEQRIETVVAQNAAARLAYYETLKRLEAAAAEAIAAGEPAPVAEQKPQLPGVPDELLALGRFAEPALFRVSQISRDDVVRAEARMLLSVLSAEGAGG